ncbi:MAG: hypothetical protein PHQ23_14955 [Candidatus Wallbacteria bacterium]|nr:hypothetical protein [Candidatus Wallbacteria bacterium]
MRKIVILTTLVLLAFCCAANSMAEVFLGLKKLRVWTQQGITLDQYAEVCRKLDVELLSLTVSSERGRKDNLTEAFAGVFQHYRLALEVWQYKYSGPETREYIPAGSSLGRELIQSYPEIVQMGESGEIIDWMPYSEEAGISIEGAVAVIWHCAGRELGQAEKMYFRKVLFP